MKPKPFEPAYGEKHTIELVTDHIEKHVGKIESGFHEIISDQEHIDVHWVKPSG